MHPCIICRECNRSGFNSDIDQVTDVTDDGPVPHAKCLEGIMHEGTSDRTVPLTCDAGRALHAQRRPARA